MDAINIIEEHVYDQGANDSSEYQPEPMLDDNLENYLEQFSNYNTFTSTTQGMVGEFYNTLIKYNITMTYGQLDDGETYYEFTQFINRYNEKNKEFTEEQRNRLKEFERSAIDYCNTLRETNYGYTRWGNMGTSPGNARRNCIDNNVEKAYISDKILDKEMWPEQMTEKTQKLFNLYFTIKYRKIIEECLIYKIMDKIIDFCKAKIEEFIEAFKVDINKYDSVKPKLKYYQNKYIEYIDCKYDTFEYSYFKTSEWGNHYLYKCFIIAVSIVIFPDLKTEREEIKGKKKPNKNSTLEDIEFKTGENTIQSVYEKTARDISYDENTFNNYKQQLISYKERVEQLDRLYSRCENKYRNYIRLLEPSGQKDLCDKNPTHNAYFKNKKQILEELAKDPANIYKIFFIYLINNIQKKINDKNPSPLIIPDEQKLSNLMDNINLTINSTIDEKGGGGRKTKRRKTLKRRRRKTTKKRKTYRK